MAEASDVVIVGGGLMGASAALFLRRRGRSVALLERGLVGQQASGVNFGNVRLSGRPPSQLPLANRARRIWERLAEFVGEDCEYVQPGRIQVAYSPDRIAVQEAYVERSAGHELDLKLLGRGELRARFPWLGDKAIAGMFAPTDGHANPRLVAPAFGRAASRAGAAVHEQCEVIGIEKHGEDFVVSTRTHGDFRAPVVLVTAGAWGARFSREFAEELPLVTRGPQMMVTEPAPPIVDVAVGVSTAHPAEGVYLRQVARGNIVVGGGPRGPASAETCRAYVDPRNTLNQLEQVRQLVPGLRPLQVIRTWSGIESYFPDDLPVMSASSTTPGLYYAFGFCGAGFQIGPGVGEVMAELIDTGRTDTPIEAFDVRRFLPGAFIAPAA